MNDSRRDSEYQREQTCFQTMCQSKVLQMPPSAVFCEVHGQRYMYTSTRTLDGKCPTYRNLDSDNRIQNHQKYTRFIQFFRLIENPVYRCRTYRGTPAFGSLFNPFAVQGHRSAVDAFWNVVADRTPLHHIQFPLRSAPLQAEPCTRGSHPRRMVDILDT